MQNLIFFQKLICKFIIINNNKLLIIIKFITKSYFSKLQIKINLPIALETPNTPFTRIIPILGITTPPAFRILCTSS